MGRQGVGRQTVRAPPASVSGANGLNGIPFILFAEMDIHFHSLCRGRPGPWRAKRPVVGVQATAVGACMEGGIGLNDRYARASCPVCGVKEGA